MLFILTPDSLILLFPTSHLRHTTYRLPPITSLASCQEQKRRIDRSGSDENVAQGSLSSLAAFPLRNGFDGAAWMFSETVFGAGPSLKRIVLFAARQEPAPLEEPSAIKIGGPTTAGPALQTGLVIEGQFEPIDLQGYFPAATEAAETRPRPVFRP